MCKGVASKVMSDPTRGRSVYLDCPEAREAQDLLLLFADLQLAAKACETLLALGPATEENGHIEEALWTSALVAYFRCFGQGERLRLRPAILFSAEQIRAHDAMKRVRDQHLAHSIDDLSLARIEIVLEPEARPGVFGVAALATRLIAPEPKEIERFRGLVGTAAAWVESRFQAVQGELLAAARRLDIAELYKIPSRPVATGSFESPRRRTRPAMSR